MGRKYEKKNRDPVTGMETASDLADERDNSGGGVPFRVSLHHTELPDANVRMNRAFRLILQASKCEGSIVEPKYNVRRI